MANKKLTAKEIRQAFLDYFAGQGHEVCPSYPLVPPNDPTLLFTNAGMVQFKDVFTGREKKPFRRATSSQKCVRAGGKHNDLENVGRTARHHTFFEMLGNFSFGDYFKKDAIRFAWEFLTGKMGLDPERLWVSVFAGDEAEGLPADEEAADIWRQDIGLPEQRILRFGKKDNFWAMGDTGPCGPCSEIHYDQGELVACSEPGPCQGVACECDRYLEVWNLVFMQFERDSGGGLRPLPAPSIDTGMGLERLAAVLQGVASNYDTDLFQPLIARAAEIAGTGYGASEQTDVSLRVIADHARATAFLMADGVLPGNEGRGYVLRRIMRRAIRHGHKLGIGEPFLHLVCREVIAHMSVAYPELAERQELISKASEQEEQSFRRTLDAGLKLLRREMAALQQRGQRVIPGQLVFDLQARDGFPPDLTAVIARENGLEIDQQGYRQAFEKHQQVSAGQLGLQGVDPLYVTLADELGPVEFGGYEKLRQRGRVLALLTGPGLAAGDFAAAGEHSRVDRAAAGSWVEAVISPTPCYGESGGQVGDTGTVVGTGLDARVVDTVRPVADLIVHRLKITTGSLGVGDEVEIQVDGERRDDIRRNHSATHLLQAALRRVLGGHVNQSGSLVAPDRFRFDFSHFAAVSHEQLAEVERQVNGMIRANWPVEISWTDLEQARRAGATMLFGEKYAERVRLVKMGQVSLELCGGTHVERTGDIGTFKILSEGSVKAGIRRIEAVTGRAAVELFQRLARREQRLAEMLKCEPAGLADAIERLRQKEAAAQRQLEQLKQKLAESGGGDPLAQARRFGEVGALAVQTEGLELAAMRQFADKLRDRLGRGAVLALGVDRGKLAAVCSVSKDLSKQLHAGKLLQAVFAEAGGRGGGRADFAQGGGGDPAAAGRAVDVFYQQVEQVLGG